MNNNHQQGSRVPHQHAVSGRFLPPTSYHPPAHHHQQPAQPQPSSAARNTPRPSQRARTPPAKTNTKNSMKKKDEGTPKTSATKTSGSGSTTPSSTTKKSTTKKRKKKPSGSRSNSASNKAQDQAAILRNGEKAKIELNQLRKNIQDRKNDLAWTSQEYISNPLDLIQFSYLEERYPNEAQLVDNALRHVGMTKDSVTAQAYGCLLEHARMYTNDLIQDAMDMAMHRTGYDDDNETSGEQNNNDIELEARDFKAAVQFRNQDEPTSNTSATVDGGIISSCLPPRDSLFLLASDVNKRPLPPIPQNCYNGIVLPPQYPSSQDNPSNSHLLINRTYDIVSSSQLLAEYNDQNKGVKDSLNEGEEKNAGQSDSTTDKQNKISSYGATKGPQIDVNIKNK